MWIAMAADVNDKTAKRWKEAAKNHRLIATKTPELEARSLLFLMAHNYEVMAQAATDLNRQRELLKDFKVQVASVAGRCKVET